MSMSSNTTTLKESTRGNEMILLYLPSYSLYTIVTDREKDHFSVPQSAKLNQIFPLN